MRRYDDPVEVRAGLVDGVEAPAQFLWRDRLWQVRAVVAHWVETAPWWDQPAVQGLLGRHDETAGRTRRRRRCRSARSRRWLPSATSGGSTPARGRLGSRGVFELVRDGLTGQWRLTGCED